MRIHMCAQSLLVCLLCGLGMTAEIRAADGVNLGQDTMPVSISPSPTVTDARVEINEQNYEQEIFAAKIPVFIQFYSSKFLGCKIQAPLVEEISRSYAGQLKFVIIDVDKHPALALAFNISRLPTLMVRQPGRDDVLVARGLLEREELKRFIEEGLWPIEPASK